MDKENATVSESKAEDCGELAFLMSRPASRLFKHPLRFFRYHRKSADGRRNFLVQGDVKMLLDQYLTVDPATGKVLDLRKADVWKETNARHMRVYAEAT